MLTLTRPSFGQSVNYPGSNSQKLTVFGAKFFASKTIAKLLRYEYIYPALDSAPMSGWFGSLGLDCVFKMYVAAIADKTSYMKVVPAYKTRPGNDQTKAFIGDSSDNVIADGPLDVILHKCHGHYDHDVLYQGVNPGTQDLKNLKVNVCRQGLDPNGRKGTRETKPLCSMRFRYDYHYCHQFKNDVDCYNGKNLGPMLRKHISSDLIYDRDSDPSPPSKTAFPFTSAKPYVTGGAECRAWFVLMDSAFRTAFGSISALLSPWLMRQCMYHEHKESTQRCMVAQPASLTGFPVNVCKGSPAVVKGVYKWDKKGGRL